MPLGSIITALVVGLIAAAIIGFFYWQSRRVVREAKNYERGLKMVPLKMHLPPASDDIENSGGRDERDITEETISQAQVFYNIIASTATKGFKSRIYGQRHISVELIAANGLIDYYIAVPMVLVDVVQQAVAAAYPSARLEEVEDPNLFSKVGKLSGTIGGEFTLKKSFTHPIATYQDSKRDAMRAILNALAIATKEDGIGVQVLLRPAPEGWTRVSKRTVEKIKRDRALGKKSEIRSSRFARDILEALWKAPNVEEKKDHEVDVQLTSIEQKEVESIEEKLSHPGYEVLIRVVASSTTAARSQVLMKNVVSAFALFDSPKSNGFKFAVTKNVEQFVTAFIFRFFPQEINSTILNSVELATVFHLPDQKNIPTSQLKRQASKQVDGPREQLSEGFLLGYNLYRGVKKEIRLSTNDRRRHLYMIGQTGTGKSKFLENLALQDMLDGKGFAFIDPHGDSAEALLGMVPKERVEDVIYFNPGEMDNPVGLNLFEFDTPDQRDFLVQEAIAMLYRLYDPGHTGIIGPRYEHWFRNAALTIMSDPNGSSFIDIPQVFNDDAFTKEKLKYVTDQTVLDFWNKEMAQTSDYHKSEVLGWFVSKFGAFLSNEMMRNIIGQTKSGFNLRKIMDEQKILLVNLSKGKTGELNSQLLGMIFVMKFQAAAMGRADIPEHERKDFGLYVDEFQNFATDSFESILSEARKYRLNLLLANQFISQLTDKIREAVIGNVGTIVSGRIGTTDAELMAKKFVPVFDAEDLTKLPNYEGVVVAQINGVPSNPFSMAFLPPLGHANPQLADALKRLSAAKYGKPRAEAEKEIFKRLRSGDEAREAKKREFEARLNAPQGGSLPASGAPSNTGSSFLDEWLAKRKQNDATPPATVAATKAIPSGAAVSPSIPQLAAPHMPINSPASGSTPPAVNAGTKTALAAQQQLQGVQNLTTLQNQGVGENINAVTKSAAPRIVTANDVVATESAVSQALKNEIMANSGGAVGDVQIRSSHTQPGSRQEITSTDLMHTEQALQKSMNDEVMKAASQESHELKINQNQRIQHDEGAPKEPDTDEIFIDLRGNLIHKSEQDEK